MSIRISIRYMAEKMSYKLYIRRDVTYSKIAQKD